jgi:hypothetical protein
MNIETKIHLNRFKPRPFQLKLCQALENDGFKKILCIWPRRAGKDITAWNLMIRAAIRRVGVYMYCLPTFRQARLVIFDSITNNGERFLDYIPKELIESVNQQEMKIKLINGSMINMIGSDTYDTSLVGTNPRMVVFSEYALADSRALQFVRPILNANGGTVIILSTPRGRNHLWELYNIAKESPDWFCYKLTLEDTQHISWEEIQREVASGEISEDLVAQEYLTSFDLGVEGSYYTKYIDKLKLNNQITIVPYENAFKVHTAWDLGLSDKTTIIFYQTIGQTIRIIDYYENKDYGLDHYVKIIQGMGYVYGKHIAPHDIMVREWAAGAVTRFDKARQLGVTFTVAPNIPVEDGIEAVRSMFSKLWIDEVKCAQLIKAIESYRREFDSKKKVYKDHPLHDWSSDPCDALRMLAVSLPKTRDGLSPEALEQRYQEAVYGVQSNQAPFFRDDLPEY